MIFWLCFACAAYTYIGYPLLVGVLARLCPSPTQRRPFAGSFAILVCAHNEQVNIVRRLQELIRLVQNSGLPGEIVVVSDGSTDATVELASELASAGPIRIVDLPDNVGKAAALTLGCQSIQADVIVFADARQTWAEDALTKLLENFADPRVGAVSGDLALQTASGLLAGVGLYWRFEKWLRSQESLVHVQVGVTGAISAVRRELFRPIPQGVILDDVYWPLCVAMQGRRVIHDERAVAFDRLPDDARDEFRRKVRTLSGNYQLARRLPSSLLPWRNPAWLAWVSHKLLRLVVPWALLAMLTCNVFLPGPYYRCALVGQIAGYAVSLVGLIPAVGKRVRLTATAGSLLALNAAACLALVVYLRGNALRSWHKVTYGASPALQTPDFALVAGSTPNTDRRLLTAPRQ